MKTKISVPLIFIILSLFTSSCNYSKLQAKSNKIALIVAVGNYPSYGGWSKISSSSDIPLIKNMLLSQGFKEQDIKLLVDSVATHDGIVAAINDIINRAQKGDIVFFHYSGHGQQIRDDNGDEIDGYDESLVPYDAYMRYKKGVYQGEKHLRDDELGNLLASLRSKVGLGGEIIVTLDACHSGTATRGFGKCRGTAEKFAEPGYEPIIKEGKDEGLFENKISTRGSADELAPLVVFSGASAEELNYEYTDDQGNSYGSLSYALSKVFSKAPKNSTYRGVFDLVKLEMSVIAPKQTPQVEGDLDKGILGGQAVEQQTYYKIKEWVDEKTCILNAGNLMGIYDNSLVAFYPINTTDPSKQKPIAEGIVANASAVECDIILKTTISKNQALNSWVFIKEKSFGDFRTKIKIIDINNSKLTDKVKLSFTKQTSINITDKNPDIIAEISKNNNKSVISLITPTDISLFSKEFDVSEEDKVINEAIEIIKSYTQVTILKNLEMEDKNLAVKFEIIPITVKKVGTRYTEDARLPINSKMVNGSLIFNEGDCFKLRITNDGYEPAYYQILDIQADNKVGLLVPSFNKTPQEYKIYPGDTVELKDIFVFGEPYGNEVFKLIATHEALNLNGIISSRGAGSRGAGEPMNPFEALLAESFTQTRAAPMAVPPSSANVYSKIITIKKDSKK
jgi:transcription termination factor NusB